MQWNGRLRQLAVIGLWLGVTCGGLGCGSNTGSSAGSSGYAGIARRFDTVGPLVQNPPILSAQAADVEDSARVIGVSVKGHHRAYRMQGMSMLETHVVNDLIDHVPVTVTYCDLKNCVRAFTTAAESDYPLAIRVRGYDDSEGMLLEINGEIVPQSSPTVSVDRLEVELMTWQNWKAAHPDTDIYLGREPDPEAEKNHLKNVVLNAPGVRRLPVQTVGKAKLLDEAGVIGVSINGCHRAYRVSALCDPRSTVLNDFIAGVPVTVTYNHWTKCVRVFTKRDGANEPLDIGVSGWENGTMLLNVDDEVVAQDSVGLERLDVESVTWKTWKTTHPDTDVYTGIGVTTEGADD